MPQNDADITDFIQKKLGAGVVGVELTTDQIDDAIEDAKMEFQALIGQAKQHTLTLGGSGGAYNMPADCLDVVEVRFDINESSLFDQFDWAGVELGPLNFGMYGAYRMDGGGVGGGYSYLVQALQNRELAKDVLSLQRGWYWSYEQKKLHIFPADGEIGTSAWTRYLVTEVDVTLLRPYEYKLLRRYALAEAMETLGNIRTKYASLPSATGDMSLNGDTMMANAETMKDLLLEKMRRRRKPDGFLVG